jgi:hypothetical protein
VRRSPNCAVTPSALGRRRTALQAALDRVLAEKIGPRDELSRVITGTDGGIASFDKGAAQATALIIAHRHRAGRAVDLRDSMMAGVAIATGAALATRNTRISTTCRSRSSTPGRPPRPLSV